ncbi:MAG: 2Fe-2S iron-sulfur cluster-binding protein [Acidobacteriota bacterium]|nr:2Fe-2S iron-sulfur cluster-binding protein [Acidobacteriota bacterium]
MEQDDRKSPTGSTVSRREFVGTAVIGGTAAVMPAAAMQATQNGRPSAGKLSCSLTINKQKHDLQVDPRTTLLDLLRENLQLTGTKKGCDHGQCGACTVIVNGERINSCMTLAVMQDGHEITTIEGLAQGNELHPMQAAFIEHDGFQCGYCTPGQICSAVAMLEELKAGAPSVVTANLGKMGPMELTDDEIRERMSGNLCRCGAYVGIVAAIRQAHGEIKA